MSPGGSWLSRVTGLSPGAPKAHLLSGRPSEFLEEMARLNKKNVLPEFTEFVMRRGGGQTCFSHDLSQFIPLVQSDGTSPQDPLCSQTTS